MTPKQAYKPHELKAGRTLFIVTRTLVPEASELKTVYGVSKHLVASRREPQPEPGQLPPYRLHPELARYAAVVTDAWRTHRAARKEAARRQRIDDAARRARHG